MHRSGVPTKKPSAFTEVFCWTAIELRKMTNGPVIIFKLSFVFIDSSEYGGQKNNQINDRRLVVATWLY